jgi:hypothetical protein
LRAEKRPANRAVSSRGKASPGLQEKEKVRRFSLAIALPEW